jgi:ABC-type glycerol-3-phosphate transport system permease component
MNIEYLQTEEFFATQTPKDSIYLHHSDGSYRPDWTIKSWDRQDTTKGSKVRSAKSYVIGGLSSKGTSDYYDGIIYAVFVSLGFALVENILYVFAHGIGIAFVRAILAVPGHGLFAVAMGYFLSLAKFNKQKDLQKYLVLSLVVPMGLHGTYNFLLMYSSNLSKADAGVTVILLIIFTVFIIFLWRHGIKKIKILVAKDSINSNITSLV